MYETIKNFNRQFLYEPEVKNQQKLTGKKSFVVVGMGGSALAPLLLKTWQPSLDIEVNRDYGLPRIPEEELENKLIIFSSYSGNTEEVIDAFSETRGKNLELAVIATGGKLLYLAKENNIPYVELPNTGIQPRMALGYSAKAFLKLMGEENGLKEISKLSGSLNPGSYEEKGKALAEKLKNHVPVIYASNRNSSVAYIWKIKLNETGKIPAFFDTFPELNHNEMTGFDVKDTTMELDRKFHFVILRDTGDNPKIVKRMDLLEKIYQDRGLQVSTVELEGESIWHKIFSGVVLADFTAYHTALLYGVEPEQIPMVEEFKKLIAE